MSTITETTVQVYQVFIKASPEQIWDAIVDPNRTTKYVHGARITVTPELRTTTSPDWSESWGEGPVFEFDPPRRLVHQWQSRYDPELADEEPSRVTWEIEPEENGVTRLTVVHDRLEGAPKTAAGVSGTGWMGVLSAMKTLLETGEPLS